MQALNVLLIEDNDEHANIITRYLRRAGDTVIHTTREDLLEAGLRRSETSVFDVILLDLRLPDSDIDETLARATETVRRIPIVVLSTLEDRDLAIRSVHQGAQDFLVKSDLTSDLLIRAIFSAIERKQTELKLQQQMAQNLVLYQLSHQAVLGQDTHETIRMVTSEVERTLELDFVGCFELSNKIIRELGVSSEILTSQAVVEVPSLQETTYFDSQSLLRGQDLTSGLNLTVARKGGKARGLLVAYSQKFRSFSLEEIKFFEAVGNILSSAFIRSDLESEVQRTIENLKIANTRKDEFLATLSHELRTPLNVISGNLELLKTNDKGSAQYNSALEAIHRNLELETKLVTDTLEMSLIISGKFILDFHDFSFDDLISSVLAELHSVAVAKEVTLESVHREPLGVIRADPVRLRQALLNLISNAVKFNKTGGRVMIQAHKENEMIHIKIEDTGGGIDPENIQNVFQGFWQEDSSSSRRYMGLGLGLALARHIIELHGGTVQVQSAGKGKGAVFTMSIPDTNLENKPVKAPSPNQERVQRNSELLSKRRSDLLQGIEILLVDDSEDTLILMKRLLERDGASVSSFISPIEGLKAAKDKRYDLIISDIGMPDLDGYELMKQYRGWEQNQGSRKVPAIALTAYVTEEDALKAKSVGYQVHMTKPMNIQNLESTILDLQTQPH